MKKKFSVVLLLAMLLTSLSGCRGTDNSKIDSLKDVPPANTKHISLEIAETLPSCVTFEYDETGKPYCFYAYDAEGNCYRVLWTDFTGLNEKDQIIVGYDEDIKEISYDEYPTGWTPQYEVTATQVKMEKRANENLVLHIQISSGADTIHPFGGLLWSLIDNQDGTFTESIIDKYDVIDLVSGKTFILVTDIPTLVLDGKVQYFVQVNGKVEKVYLLALDENEYRKSDTTFDELSNLEDGTYYVVLEVLLSGNCDPDAPQHSYRYEDVFRLDVERDREEPEPYQPPDPFTNVVDELEFSKYLDDMQFVPGLSRADFISLLEQFRYKNEKITDVVMGVYYDGPHGGGWQGRTEQFEIYNDYKVSEDNTSATYSNCFYTKVPLEGMELPYGISFEDSLDDTFGKIGIRVNINSDFIPDNDTDTYMTLYGKDGESFVLQDLRRTKEHVEYELPYRLVYTEKYSDKQKNGKLVSVERMVKLYFRDGNTGENIVLGGVEISVIENRVLE